MKEYEYHLTWSGRKDTPELQSVMEYLKVFPLFKDSKARLISYDEYMALAKKGLIKKPVSYWMIKERQVGLITLTYYQKFSDTWERINTAKGDFLAGWKAREVIGK